MVRNLMPNHSAALVHSPLSVLIVDTQAIARLGLRTILASDSELTFAGECDNPVDALRLATSLLPRVAVIDLLFPGAQGFGLLKDMRIQAPDTRVLMWSSITSAAHAEYCMSLGAAGLVSKNEPPDRVLEAVRNVARGQLFVDQQCATELVSLLAARRSETAFGGRGGKGKTRLLLQSAAAMLPIAASSVDMLSGAEFEVLHMIGQGNTTRDIASQLHRSTKTVETYRSRIRGKLGLTNPTQLAQWAWRFVHGAD